MNQKIKGCVPGIHQLCGRITCRIQQVWLFSLIIFFTQFGSSICLSTSGLHAPYQMTSDPHHQKLFDGALSSVWVKYIRVFCFTEPQAFALLILTLIHLFRERRDMQANGAAMPAEISSGVEILILGKVCLGQPSPSGENFHFFFFHPHLLLLSLWT